jgi:hypothetical protein
MESHQNMIAASPERQSSDAHTQSLNRVPRIGPLGLRRELVRRIVHSPTFAKSERLGTLLTYVCDLTLNGREAEINEQKIGQAVFGRSPEYDSSADGIVRSQASRLRQRLELYYQHEGAEEPVRIVIPRGGYVPVFETQSVPASPVVTPTVETQDASPLESAPNVAAHSRFVLSWNLLSWGLCLVLAAILVAVLTRDHRKTQFAASIEKHPLWRQLFTKSEPAMIVVPDSGLVLYHALSARDIDLKEYLEAGYRSEANGSPQSGPTASERDRLLDLANRRYTSLVDVNAILGIRDRAQTLGTDVTVRYARDLRPNDLKNGTIILLGAYTANPWIELFEPKLNFVLKDDYVSSFSIVNRSPQNGEPASWVSSKSDPQRRAYGVIAFVPNLEGNGNALLLEGIGMSGTEAAMDFLGDDKQLLPFLSKIQRADGSIPHFELVLETRNMDASAVQSKILAWRVMN